MENNENKVSLLEKKNKLKKQLRLLKLQKFAFYIIFDLVGFGICTYFDNKNNSGSKDNNYAYYEAQVLDDGSVKLCDDSKYYDKVDSSHTSSLEKDVIYYDDEAKKYMKTEYNYDLPDLVFSNNHEIIDNIDNILDYLDGHAQTSETEATEESVNYKGNITIRDENDYQAIEKIGPFSRDYFIGYLMWLFILAPMISVSADYLSGIDEIVKKLKLELKELKESEERKK